LAANDAADCTLRLFVVGGEGGEAGTAYLWPQPPTIYPASYYANGVSVITFEGQRFMPEAKSLNTLVSTMARRKAAAMGAHEGLLYHEGMLTEGAVSNLFAVIGNEIVTPPTGTVLSGVTRDTVMRLALRDGLPLREASLSLTGVASWQECFITSTSRHIMPVTAVDGLMIGDGNVGPLTRRLTDLFAECFAQSVSCFA
jgi:branched-subunit amino acid aminotransferase/4-amino-4-deoxychorismate lyase